MSARPISPFVSSLQKKVATEGSDELMMVDTRKAVLSGGFTVHKDLSWQSPQRKILIFLSRTVDDTFCERKILVDTVLPLLREKGQTLGVEVDLLEVRSQGQEFDSVDSHLWKDSKESIDRCIANSLGIVYVSLLANRYK